MQTLEFHKLEFIFLSHDNQFKPRQQTVCVKDNMHTKLLKCELETLGNPVLIGQNSRPLAFILIKQTALFSTPVYSAYLFLLFF